MIIILKYRKQAIVRKLYYFDTLRFFADRNLGVEESKTITVESTEVVEIEIERTPLLLTEEPTNQVYFGVLDGYQETLENASQILDIIQLNHINYEAPDHMMMIALNNQEFVDFKIILKYLTKLKLNPLGLSHDYSSSEFINDLNITLLQNLYPISEVNMPSIDTIITLPLLFEHCPATVAILNTIVLTLLETQNLEVVKNYLDILSTIEPDKYSLVNKGVERFFQDLSYLNTHYLTIKATINDIHEYSQTLVNIPIDTEAKIDAEELVTSNNETKTNQEEAVLEPLEVLFQTPADVNLRIIYNYATYLTANNYNALTTISNNLNIISDSQATISHIVDTIEQPNLELTNTPAAAVLQTATESLSNSRNTITLPNGDFINIFELVRRSNTIQITESLSLLRQNSEVFIEASNDVSATLEESRTALNEVTTRIDRLTFMDHINNQLITLKQYISDNSKKILISGGSIIVLNLILPPIIKSIFKTSTSSSETTSQPPVLETNIQSLPRFLEISNNIPFFINGFPIRSLITSTFNSILEMPSEKLIEWVLNFNSI
jgi:hypothetical protein